MTTFIRKTEFWSVNTPNKVGPGSYNLSPKRESKPSSAPFETSTKREEIKKLSVVGPGSYLGHDPWDIENKGPNLLASQSPRMGPFATGIIGFNMPTNVYNPGPGTYITETQAKKNSPTARRNSLTIDPTPISIPSRERKNESIGPATYNPDMKRVKPSSTSTTFGGYLSKRSVFEGNEEGPGPGEYSSENSKGVGYIFPKSAKSAKITNTVPGPGAYDQPKDRKIRKEPIESFGVMEKKHIMFSKDPHRPIQVGYSENPPVGIYDNADKIKNAEKLKQKFISYEAPIPKPGFNVSTKREMHWVDNPSFPGPGAYTEVKASQDKNEKIPFGSKEDKFHKLNVLAIPGPGTYVNLLQEKIVTREKPSSVFASKTPRFRKIATDNLSVSVVGLQPNIELEQSHAGWRAKQVRAFDTVVLKPVLSFESTAERFSGARKDASNPGPGYYECRPSSVPTRIKRTEKRFGSFDNYRPKTGTTQNVGPGSYMADLQVKKSFNMSGELSRVRPWIS
ncbi:hypothetical protein SteCoe_33049 [Stentor coeruleus]|uniref:Sperm-tail PG-rich repeat-containing protein 2 n=1 Tax=Stentor coeruleus TaxID=5963 RepID=A0A1R2AXQ9_9CILI|nr:hypothetical protein SteCoe_33049 [Stentor coeruleus]